MKYEETKYIIVEETNLGWNKDNRSEAIGGKKINQAIPISQHIR